MAADPVWDPIFARILTIPEAVRCLVLETPAPVLLQWIRPNPRLSALVGPFLKGGRLIRGGGLETALVRYAREEPAFANLVLRQWVNDHPKVFAFLTRPASPASDLAELRSGKYGAVPRWTLMAHLDPRPEMAQVYAQLIAEAKTPSLVDRAEPPAATRDAAIRDAATRDAAAGDAAIRDAGDTGGERDLRERVQQLEAERHEQKRLLREAQAQLEKLESQVAERTRERDRLRDERDAARRDAEGVRQTLTQTQAKAERAQTLLTAAEKRAAELAAAGDAERARGLSERCAALQRERDDLGERLGQAERKLARALDDRGAAERARDGEADARGQVVRLQEQLRAVEHELARWRHGRVGRLVAAGVEGIFETLAGERLVLPADVLARYPATVMEYVVLIGEPSAPDAVFSRLEGPVDERVGVVRTPPGAAAPVLDCGGEHLCLAPDAAVVVVERQWHNTPLAGRWLAAMPERPAGIWALRQVRGTAAAMGASPGEVGSIDPLDDKQYRVAWAALRQRLGVVGLQPEAVLRACQQAGIQATADDQGITFDRVVATVLAALRPTLEIAPLCRRAACLDDSPRFALYRWGAVGDVCAACHEEIESAQITGPAANPVHYDFGGRAVVLLGGDRVGSHYRDHLAAHRLEVTWHSGFTPPARYREGLGRYAAVAVILREVSHTVLRELLPAAQRDRVRLVYLRRRGVSGVTAELAQALNARSR